MALINLKHIGLLALEADSQYMAFESFLYNRQAKPSSDFNDLIVFQVKARLQANNIFSKLDELHRVCTDFAADNHQPYMDDSADHIEGGQTVYLPFSYLTSIVSGLPGFACDLPHVIEQYHELLQFAKVYPECKKRAREKFIEVFGESNRKYLINDPKTGEVTFLSASELPQDMKDLINAKEAENEIEMIEVQYCLDKYNQFFSETIRLIDAYKTTGDVRGCAKAILSMYAFKERELTQQLYTP